jgi:hypothetical protein
VNFLYNERCVVVCAYARSVGAGMHKHMWDNGPQGGSGAL